MPIPSKDAWHQIQDTVVKSRANIPKQGLTGGVPARNPPYHGYIRVLGVQLGSGHQLGVMTEHNAETDTFVDRNDVPVWVRTPRKNPLEYWLPGCGNGVGVFWGRAQDVIRLEGAGVTGTGIGTAASKVTGTGVPPANSIQLPLYIVDDCCPDPVVTCGSTPVECSFTSSGNAAEAFSLTIAGVSGTSGSLDCTVYNGTWLLSFIGANFSACVWESPKIGTGSPSDLHAELNVNDDGTVTLFIIDVTVEVSYTHPGPWDGTSDLTLNFGTNFGGCTGWPSTLTILVA